ncbi:MAG: MFS transporter, partial [Caldiserica bacterium]|nr:MFS transporter [Caldisericota bacterium]
MLMGFGRTLPIWLISGFLGSLIIPFLNGCNDAIWQAKVPHDVQGKVFGTRMMIAQVSVPVAMLTAGPLADLVFEPRMMPGGVLAGVFGRLVGVGRGAGMALMFVLFGGAALLASVASFMVRDIRDVEVLIPDYAPPDEEAPEEAISVPVGANAHN